VAPDVGAFTNPIIRVPGKVVSMPRAKAAALFCLLALHLAARAEPKAEAKPILLDDFGREKGSGVNTDKESPY
jgi:hypothetical protein